VSERGEPRAEHLLLGAYVLGGLAAGELIAFERHLGSCAECRRELDSFAPLSAMFGTLPAQSARSILAQDSGPPAAADGRDLVNERVLDPSLELMRRLRARRRTRRFVLGAVAAASVAGGVFLAPVLRPAPAPDAAYEVVSTAGPRVDLGLNAKAWGTELQFRGTELPTSGTLSLWVVDQSGQGERAGSWNATKTGTARLSGAVPTEMGRISAIQLRDMDSRILAELNIPGVPSSRPG
jgi:hypothetical protein